MTKVNVIQPEDKSKKIPVDILAESIVEISNAVKKMRNGGLTDRAIILLIHDSSSVGKPAIKAVLDSMETLSEKYIRKNKK